MPRTVARTERQQALGLVALAVGIGLAAATLDNSVVGWVVGPLGVAAVGAAVVWREADETQRRRWAGGATGPAGAARVLRVLTGVVFVAAGIAVFLLGNIQLGQAQFALLAVLATLVGVAVLTVPWWLRLVRELGEERRERIVEAERAEIAAHLHDSVLQTLALIQRQTDQPREVLRLARGQERELRHWLYGPTGYGRSAHASGDPALDAGLADAITAAAAEVEDTYAIDVRPVVVGDATLDDGLRALVLAAREAMVNAAKHAEVGEISVYVEAEPTEVHVFVRDRGVGFDPDAVPDDRHGLADSVHGRMARHGGTVRLRSTPGEGTEVHLTMPVAGAARPPRKRDDATMSDEQARTSSRSGCSWSTTTRCSAPGCAPSWTAASPTCTVVGEAGSVDEAVAAVRHLRPDVVLLDVHMPDGGGAEVLRQLRPELPDVVFLALSVSDAAEDVIAVIRAGARGYVTKTISGRELADAVRRVHSGDAVFSPRLAGFVLDVFSDRPGAAPPGDPELDLLTRRERDVLRLLARGYAYKEIAGELFISVKTVETHVSSVLRKTQLSNRYELSRWASDRRLV